MGEKLFVQGNEAVAWGALNAGCEAFFGYPITPQNEITEWFAREYPKRGKVFVQSQSETGSINMLHGAAACGVRAMTSTSGPGWGLMQEGMSNLANAELPCVIVLVQRGGPGAGTTRHAQMDYSSVTHGGGAGGYKNIVLAPDSVQELHDFVQLAFYLADKYRNPVIVLSDAILGQMAEPLELRQLEFGPLPVKDWAICGKAHHPGGQRRGISIGQGFIPNPEYSTYLAFMEHLDNKTHEMKQNEVRYEAHHLESAQLILVSFGSVARASQGAMDMARDAGLPVGLLRPLTLWPFPYEVIRQNIRDGVQFLVVEDNLGQMIEDVNTAVGQRTPVHYLGMLARHEPREMGMIFPDRILEKIKEILAK
ncbi:MAG: 3-methyl-2-oxobutanoate dehydrogenase subunit VorB [Dehalococcoidia bacterium]|nr:3-methyl-2-oxobutanoate dehydrogenase subunit VorB [Dehalococcoidia bacterium]